MDFSCPAFKLHVHYSLLILEKVFINQIAVCFLFNFSDLSLLMFLHRYFRASFGILEMGRLLVKGNVWYPSLVSIRDVKVFCSLLNWFGNEQCFSVSPKPPRWKRILFLRSQVEILAINLLPCQAQPQLWKFQGSSFKNIHDSILYF